MTSVFDEQIYRAANPDVAVAIDQGEFRSALEHFEKIGRKKGLISNATHFIIELVKQVKALKSELITYEAQCSKVSELLGASNDKVLSLENDAQVKATYIAELQETVNNLTIQIAEKNTALHEYDGQLASIKNSVHDKDRHIANIEANLIESITRFEKARQSFFDIMKINPKIRRDRFDSKYYLKTNPDVSQVAKTNIDPIAHYIFNGTYEGRRPHPPKALPALLPAIVAKHGLLGITKKSLTIYQQSGLGGLRAAVTKLRAFHSDNNDAIKRIENVQRTLSTSFDEALYLSAHPDIAAAVAEGQFQNGWHHYEETGRREGRVATEAELAFHETSSGNNYAEWILRYDTVTQEKRLAIKARIALMTQPPLISVVMPVYNPPLAMLEAAILSVQGQLYPYWELCIADDASKNKGVHKLLKRYAAKDARIKVVFRKKNGHISAASNSALSLVKGAYIALLDNDDLLPELALYWLAEAIVANPNVGMIYSDEDKIDQAGKRYDPYFKPDWNPDLFLSHNMVCHLGAYNTALVKKLGGFREGLEGAQDYDLALRCSEQLTPQQIFHIPRVLYHWRSHPGSTAQAGSEKNYALEAGERALNDHFVRIKVPAKASLLDFGIYKACYEMPINQPLVSLIIPTRNGLALIKQCIDSIFAKTTYTNYEIIIVDNNSDDPKALAYFESLEQNNHIRVIRDQRPFNFSALNNTAVQHARGEYIGLINNDIEVISPEWLTEMISLARQPGVGGVGARLWYPNDTLQHGGVIIGLGGVAGHSHKYLEKNAPGFFGRAQLIQTMSAVTAACLIIKKSIYEQVDGLNEVNLEIAFNDIDFCLRVREAGYRNVWTPYAELYHHESATRGVEDTPEKEARFSKEVLYMKKRWGDALMNDPAYSPNLTLDREDFSYAWPPRVD